MLDLYTYLDNNDEKNNLLQMVHIKYKFLLLHKDLERRIIKERGSLTKSEKEELFYEMKSLYDESLELLTQYKNDEIELLRKGLLENE